MENINLLITVVSSFICGFILGAFALYRGLKPKSRQQVEMERDKALAELKTYQNQVADHFNHTATLFNNLTRDYRSLHDYLASSAQQLSNLDIQPAMLSDGYANAQILGRGTVVNPPLDYAASHGTRGTLSEEYGLKEEPPKKPPSAEGYTDLLT